MSDKYAIVYMRDGREVTERLTCFYKLRRRVHLLEKRGLSPTWKRLNAISLSDNQRHAK